VVRPEPAVVVAAKRLNSPVEAVAVAVVAVGAEVVAEVAVHPPEVD
jgi:hypothetical protein